MIKKTLENLDQVPGHLGCYPATEVARPVWCLQVSTLCSPKCLAPTSLLMAQRVTTTSNLHRQVSEAQPLCSLLPGSPMHSTSFIFQQAMTCMFAFNAKSKESSAKMLHLNGTLLFVVSLYIRFYWGAFCDRTPPEKGAVLIGNRVHPIVSLHAQSCWNLLLTPVFLHSLLTTPHGL